MKRVLVLISVIFLLTGCMNINNSSYEEIINSALNNKKILNKNKTSQGYSYYLPKGLIILEDLNNNLTLKSEKYNIYLYVDLVSYYNKIKNSYQENKNVYFSKTITNKEQFGYLEINLREKDKYLIEIMYNYAKIEVVVYEKDIKNVLANAMTIISSVSYNDNIIINYLASSSFEGNEEVFNIFEIVGRKDFLQVTDEETQEEEIRDPDFIN